MLCFKWIYLVGARGGGRPETIKLSHLNATSCIKINRSYRERSLKQTVPLGVVNFLIFTFQQIDAKTYF